MANDPIYRQNRKHLRQAPSGNSIMEQGAEDEFRSTDQQTIENDQLIG